MYKEIIANMWSEQFKDDVKVITTNGNVKSDGRAVMGRGLALQAIKLYPKLQEELGEDILFDGNRVFYYPDYKIVTFPTKYNWWEKSNIDLICKSLEQLCMICLKNNINKIIFPHVGCNNGGLEWNYVKNKIIKYLNINNIEFIVVNLT